MFKNFVNTKYLFGLLNNFLSQVIFVLESGWLRLDLVSFLPVNVWHNLAYAGDCWHDDLQWPKVCFTVKNVYRVHKRDFQTPLCETVYRRSSTQRSTNLLAHSFSVYNARHRLTSYYAVIHKCDVDHEWMPRMSLRTLCLSSSSSYKMHTSRDHKTVALKPEMILELMKQMRNSLQRKSELVRVIGAIHPWLYSSLG